MHVWVSGTQIVYVRDGSAIVFRASVSRMEGSGCGFFFAPRASVTPAESVFRRKADQVDSPRVDNLVAWWFTP